MPRKDKYHDAVREALLKDGWTITDDPLTVQVGFKELYIDLGAEKVVIGAEKGGERIAVEIKSLLRKSQFFDYYQSLGQFLVYRLALEKANENRILFLAVPNQAFLEYSQVEIFQDAWATFSVHLIVFDEEKQIVLQWIKQ